MAWTWAHRKEVLRKRHNELIRLLGGQCVDCGETSLEILEPDHLEPRDYYPSKLSWHCRLSRYFEGLQRGALVCRCRSCNAKRGHPKLNQTDLPLTEPF